MKMHAQIINDKQPSITASEDISSPEELSPSSQKGRQNEESVSTEFFKKSEALRNQISTKVTQM